MPLIAAVGIALLICVAMVSSGGKPRPTPEASAPPAPLSAPGSDPTDRVEDAPDLHAWHLRQMGRMPTGLDERQQLRYLAEVMHRGDAERAARRAAGRR